MKTLVAALVLALTAPHALAVNARARVVVRDDNFHPRIQEETLTGLVSAERFDGANFKVVDGKGTEAIRLDNPDRELVLRAATAYFHLVKARDWFIRNVQSSYVAGLPKLVVRVNIKNQFNELGQFAHDSISEQFNNALTIPGGESPDFVPPEERRVWGTEIWFRPGKRVNIDDLDLRDPALGEWGRVLSSFRQQTHMSTLQRFLTQAALAGSGGHVQQDYFGWENIIRVAGTSLMLEAMYRFADPISRFFSRKIFWLDTALIPEIIYHEYSHVALSDHLVLSHSSAVIEGMADYFAGRIANSSKLATDIDQYNTFNGKRATRNQQYRVEFETTDWANADFVFGMLWDLQTIVGTGTPTDTFIYALRERLTTSDTIRRQFIDGVLNTCNVRCSDRFNQRIQILRRYDARGI